MRKTIVLLGFAAALGCPSVALAVSGTTSGYGTQGYGPHVPTRSLTPAERSWNADNESKMRARASAEWMRRRHYHHPPLPF